MDTQTRENLFKMLKTAMAGYGKPAPEPEIFEAWVEFLSNYPLHVIRRALGDHCNSSDFAPVAAVIAKRCRELDGRPTADEAWALAISSIDEAETVVWTSETAAAFYACRPILDNGDKVGARMAFRDTYNRLIADARLSRVATKWETSLGWDMEKRKIAIQNAQVAGLLSYDAQTPVLMLEHSGSGEPGSGDDQVSDDSRRVIAEKVRALLAELRASPERAEKERLARVERERMEFQRQKDRIAESVAGYERGIE